MVGKKRATTWLAPAPQNVIAVASTGTAIIASFDAFANGLPRPTVVRNRGEVTVRPQAFSSDVAISGAFGIGIVSDSAFAAGAASVPSPFSDANWGGWFVWQSFSMLLEVSTDVGRLGVTESGAHYQVDSKAMRKIGDDETLVMVAESQSGAFNIAMHIRTLLKLS